MHKSAVLISLLFLFAGTYASAQEKTTADKLQEAAGLYFAYQPEKALNAYVDISKETSDREAFLNAAFIAMEQNNSKLAVDIATAAYRAYPQDSEIIQTAAEAYLADGQYAAAEMLLSQLSEEPGRAELLHINLARAQIGMGEKKLAKNNLKLATRGKVHTALSNYLLGLLYEEENNYKKAVKHFKVASEYDHQFIEAKMHYANALEKTRDYNEAYRQYRMIYTLEKKNDTVRNALARLLPKLTRSEKELTAGKTRKDHTLVKMMIIPDGKKYPQEIKVGLGMNPNGRPPQRTTLQFVPSHVFVIQDDKGNEILRGNAKENWTALLENGKTYLQSPAGKKIPFHKSVTIRPISHTAGEGHTILVKQLMSGAGMTWASLDDKEYRGKLQIVHNTRLNTLVPINVLTVDEYLQGVISSEMPVQFPMDALRAQAVLARTYALKHLGKHKSYGYDLCDTQNCQVYGGVSAESERANAAVESTIGEVLLYNGKPIESVFSANCGGITQSSKDAGWSDTPYLHPVSDYKDFDFSTLQPYHFKNLLQYYHDAYSRYDKNVSMAAFRWVRVVEEKELREVIKRQKKDIGEIKALIPLRRGKSGYVSRLLVKGTKGSVTLNKENVIRNNLSLGMLRSSYFIVEPNYENRKLKYFVFYGGGWGHGVGFDQTGAAGRADAGQDYKTILQHYFPKAEFTEGN
ncbi:SpoIID/LytB domain-containing protein [Candidatus Avelusimicrobium caledoniensis]|uniref:SpoIID/LytB domain-containing protein n=1 Tax=Candidatus Avelusimicrobium caledoniensis TaxID=3416220 RepID=UPI003D121C83